MFKFKLKILICGIALTSISTLAGSKFITKEYKFDRLNSITYNLPNGYSMKHFIAPDSNISHEEILAIYKNKKTLYSKRDYSILVGKKRQSIRWLDENESIDPKDVLLDVDNDGVKEVLFYTYSGGAHCCSNVYLIELNRDKLSPMLELFLKNVEKITFKDINRDGLLEIYTYDDSYSYLGSLSFAESPFPKIVLELKDGHYVFSKRFTKKLKINNKKRGVGLLLEYIYRGKYKKGLEIINKIEEERLKKYEEEKRKKQDKWGEEVEVFYYSSLNFNFDELVDRMSKSPYWEDIKEMNGWKKLSKKEILELLSKKN